MPLTDKFLKSIKAQDSRFELADTNGLSIRVSPKGRVIFQTRFRFDGKAQRLDFGPYPEISLSKARELNQAARNMIAIEINPITAKNEKRIDQERAITIEQLVKEFMSKEIRGRLKLKRPDYVEKILEKNITPVIGQMKAKDVTKRDIVSTLEKIVERGSPVMANRASTIFKQMFNFAEARGWIDKNPCMSLTKTSIGGKEVPRQEHLTYKQIWSFWHGLDNTNICEQLKIGLKLLLITGQRRGELIYGKWVHVDLDKMRWTIPSSLSKNGKEHLVHLSPLAIDFFHQLQKIKSNSYLIPAVNSKEDLPISERAINRAVARIRQELGLDSLTPHVLRHTFSTHLSGLKVPPHVIEKLLNHQLGGMFAVYNHHNYYIEHKDALNLWSDLLNNITTKTSSELVLTEPDLFE